MTVIDMVKQYRRANAELRIRLFIPTLHDARTITTETLRTQFRKLSEWLRRLSPPTDPPSTKMHP